MWWLDPGKEVLNVPFKLFNRILAPYVENLDLNQVNYGIGQGQLTLRNLRLKKGALDKFQLPVDVAEGRLGRFTLALHWMNLGNQPVEILIEDVYLLVIPSPQTNIEPEEEEERAQAAKAERLANAELLHLRSQTEASSEDSSQPQGLWQSLMAKIINNIQITIRNIHIRYEDNISVPNHPFAAGLTLTEFTAASVNDKWRPAFIESTAGAIHKLAKLRCLALYFDTDAKSMMGLSPSEMDRIFSDLEAKKLNHQFILKPVTGEGRIVVNHKADRQTPRYDVQLIFKEIGVALDDHQYRDIISLVHMYHVYLRRRQYHKFRPSDDNFQANPARARLQFAGTAVLEGVRERSHKWTWVYFAERRDDRNTYVALFQKKLLNSLIGGELDEFAALERKLSYEDLRFYRSIARSRLRKDEALRKQLEADKTRQTQKQSWTSWLWGSGTSTSDTSQSENGFGGTMTSEQRKQLYEILDYDEKTALAESFQAPRDSLKARVSMHLQKGSISLICEPHGDTQEVMSVVFDIFQAKLIQRPDNFEASMTLGGLSVYDGTTPDSLYPQIVRVKSDFLLARTPESSDTVDISPDAFFLLKLEHNPLDERADNALTVRMQHMEVIYHKGYVEAIYKFFKPPASQLESVEALLNVASQTLEGLRKETRAGLEYALQMHKTIDVQMDLHAPLIIVPEDVTTHDCNHLIIDAGHIAVESKLADKKDLRSIQQKRQQAYNEEDYRNLESLMYDKFILRLEAAQFVIGDNLQACRNALPSDSVDTLHLLERVNIELQLQNSIVPTVVSLARFKIAGKLPHLKINFSDSKYKALMRLIDVCVPSLDGEEEASQDVAQGFPLTEAFFGPTGLEYHSDTDSNDNGNGKGVQESIMAVRLLVTKTLSMINGRPFQRLDLRQHIVEIDFRADSLSASLAKTDAAGSETPLGDVVLERFALKYALAKYDMQVDIQLRSLSMTLERPGKDAINFMSSAEHTAIDSQDLLSVRYRRVQDDSPEFLTLFEGVHQQVDVDLSTFVFQASPEPVLAVYDFVMTTFVQDVEPQPKSKSPEGITTSTSISGKYKVKEGGTNEKIRLQFQLASVQVSLIRDTLTFATLSLSTANVGVLLQNNTINVNGRLGNLSFIDQNMQRNIRSEFRQILSIEGENFAEFSYQTFDPAESHGRSAKSIMALRTASLKIHYLEGPFHDVYAFFMQLARLKEVYDAATQVAVQKATQIDRMQFEVSIKSPIVIFPADPERSLDVLVMRLGEVSARNTLLDSTSETTASLSGIQLVSEIYVDGFVSPLKIIDDIHVTSTIIQRTVVEHHEDMETPDTQVTIKVSDVKLHLTQTQYCLLVDLSKSIQRALGGGADVTQLALEDGLTSKPTSSSEISSTISLQPELKVIPGKRAWISVDIILSVNVVRLHLYDAQAFSEQTLKGHGIARFALHDNTLRLKALSDGSIEAQVTLRSFTVTNTRPGNSRFREIIPAAQHDRNQFTILYTASGSESGSSLAVLTIDSPKIIFAIDPVISVLGFITSAFFTTTNNPPTSSLDPFITSNNVDSPSPVMSTRTTFDYRIDLHDASISVLENDTNLESQAIQLTINQILLSQQGIIALKVDRLGMSLTRMGKPTESVRFLDDVDITVSLDNRSSALQQMTSIEIFTKAVTVRASYRDVMLISSIVTKAIEMYGKSQNSNTAQSTALSQSVRPNGRKASFGPRSSTGKARVVMTKEQLKCSVDGFRLVLIGDLHEQPVIHLKVKPFIVGVQDWSGELRTTTTIDSHINYWNLTNSHWEPLIDPWTFTFSVTRDGISGGIGYSLTSRERLDLNVSAAFVELVSSTLKVWSREGTQVLQKGRGMYAPYRIRNRTGVTLDVWPDTLGGSDVQEISAVKLSADQTIDWRFDDWRTTREHVSLGQHSIGLRFDGKPWEELRSIPVDREGEYTFPLRPQAGKYPLRILCEIKVVDCVKLVILRSTYKVENNTLYPLELLLVNEQGQPAGSLEKLAPGEDYPLPIDVLTRYRVRIQPDQGFGYRWCSAIRWEDLIAKKSFTITCSHVDPKEAPFRIQASVQMDDQVVTQRKCPKITLRLCAPLEIENLLPYNLDYRIYDKTVDQTWMSYLRKGGVMPVHSVELTHLLLLNIVVQDTVFKPSDFAVIHSGESSDYDVDNQMALRDSLNRQLRLKLNYVRYLESGGAFKIQIYTPYIIVNKTNLPFWIRSVRSTRAGVHDSAGEHRTVLSHAYDNGHEFTFKIGESTWSKLVSVEAPSAEAELVASYQKRRFEEMHTGISWSEGLGKYKVTKVITLSPRFLLKNNLLEAITFRQHGGTPSSNAILEAGGRSPLRRFRADSEKLLTIAYPGLNAQWSSPFDIEAIGAVHFRLRSQETSQMHLIRADIQINGATIFITISPSNDQWPFKIENESDYPIKIRQTADSDETSARDSEHSYTIERHSSLYYAWDHPAAKEKKLQLSIKGFKRVIDMLEIGDLIPFKFYDNQRSKIVALDLRADEHMQVLRITPYNPERSLYKPRQRSNSTLMAPRSDSVSSITEFFEAVPETVAPTLTYLIDLTGIGVSLVNKNLIEVVYVTADALKFEYTNSPVAQTINLSCGNLQIDNQLHDALFPVILQPTPIPKNSGVAALPTIQLSIIWLNDDEHGVIFVKYCSILLQALSIEADEDLLFSLYDFAQIEGLWEKSNEDALIQNLNEIPEPPSIATGRDVYFEILELQPVMLSLSFMRTERINSAEKLNNRDPLAVALNALTMTLGNINDAPVQLNALAIKDMRLTTPELVNRVLYHYRQDILRQLYRILGSADFIGNPVGLFNNVSSGVADIFYEPFHGVVMRGNKELGIGIAKGAASFVKKTVFGVSDSVTKFTSSVSKGLSAATFDSEYQARRRLNMRRNRPKHAIYGVAAGGEALASSVTSAVEGVLMKPIEGAETEGAIGFFKGIGKGLVGAVTKPVVGVFDLASNVSEGIRNTTTVFDNPEKDRVRMVYVIFTRSSKPRLIPPDRVLRPYSLREATGQYWMKDLNDGAYRRESYVAHINSPGGDNVVLLTSMRVLSFWLQGLRLAWELPFTEVQGVTVEDTGIRFAHKSGKEHNKFVHISDKESQSWFFRHIASVVKSFNARRRMES
ncbi:hypothetical protein AMATHDRAFT_72271 [Amanita thiersii Skay4041]|uniref:Vacuolar protein sorting-associated protein 13 n=1 Tax=Amanita thiersii Skay4041 TaxID=703135 RepID=A0A2A9P1E9_9AGAR|nr:hypothetical protein AMATHDRAFT_72271 [Amanita thiersii Skay4041]